MADYLNDEKEKSFILMVILTFIIIMTGIYFNTNLSGLAFVIGSFWAGFYGKELSKFGRIRESAKAGFDPRASPRVGIKVKGEMKPPQETSDTKK